MLDGLILAGGADIDPASYGEAAARGDHGTWPERDDFEVALARRALERDIPLLGICRGMQLMNVARGGTLIQHLPDDVGHEDHRRVAGSFDGADHDVRLADGSLAARAAGEVDHAHQVPPPPGDRAPGGGAGRDRLEHARRAARGDRGPRPPLRPRRAVAPGGRPGLAADRLARARGGRGARTADNRTTLRLPRSYARPRCAPVDRHPPGGVHGARRRVRGAAGAPPSEAPAARGHRHGGDGSVRALRARPALAQARRRGGLPADVGLRGDLPDAQRRPDRARAARAHRLPGARGPRDRPRRDPDAAPAARLRPAGADQRAPSGR